METFMLMLTCSSRCLYILTMLTNLSQASYDYNNWITPSSPTLPYNVDTPAVAYNSINNTIWILGSASHQQYTLISYDIDSNNFTGYGYEALYHGVWGEGGVWGDGDFYTQVGDVLYTLDPWENKLSTFNVNTAQFTYYYQNIDIPESYGAAPSYYNYWGCLASMDDVLFVLGQFPNIQTVRVLNLTTSIWIVSPEVAYLNQGRKSLSCIVHPYNNALYAIGGSNDTGAKTETIEKLYVGDLAHLSQYDWEFINSLPHPRA
eukprot:591851_1